MSKGREKLIKLIDSGLSKFPESAVFDKKMLSSDEKIALYIHYPFCKTECAMCSFYKVKLGSKNPEEKKKIIDALAMHILSVGSKFGENPLDWIYFGGGTPSLISESDLRQLMSSIESIWKIEQGVAITMEMRVDDLDSRRVDLQEELGCNRWSVGVQTLADRERKQYGLLLSSEEVIERLQLLEGKSYNVDLIFGGPNQSMEDWVETLTKIMMVRPPEISAYLYMPLALTHSYEKSDKKKTGKWLKWKYLQYQMTKYLVNFMVKNGYKQTDALMFSRTDSTAPHDVSMIANKSSVVGIGPSAYSLMPHLLVVNPYDIDAYTKKITSGEELTYLGRKNDMLIKSLRTVAGNIYKLSKAVSSSDKSGSAFTTFINYWFWTGVYNLARDWNTLTSTVGYRATPISRKLNTPKNKDYQL